MSSARPVYKNSCLKIFKRLTLGLFLTNLKNISEIDMDKYTGVGSLCWEPLSNLQYFVVFPPLMMQDSLFF